MSRTPEDQARYYRDKAEELRMLLDGMTDTRGRDSLMEVIREYEMLAHRAQEKISPPKT